MLYFIFFLVIKGTTAQGVWRCSNKTDTGVHYLPDLDWIGSSSTLRATVEIGDSRGSTTYAYPIPAVVGCAGTVSALEFCYGLPSTGINDAPPEGYLVFNLSTLRQNNNLFTVINIIPVYSIPDTDKCSLRNRLIRSDDYFCCDTVTLNTADQFQLPQENFALGITTPSSSANLQRFVFSYRLEHFQQEGLTSLSRDMMYDLGDSFEDELRTVRLHLTPVPPSTTQDVMPSTILSMTTMSISADTPTATVPTTSTSPTTPGGIPTTMSAAVDSTTSIDITPPDTVSIPLSINMPNGTLSSGISITSDITTMTTSSNTVVSGGEDQQTTTTVGVAIGGTIVILLSLTICVVLLVIFILSRRRRQKQGIRKNGIDHMGYAIYNNSDGNTLGGGMALPENIPGDMYSEVGPSTCDNHSRNWRNQDEVEGEQYKVAQWSSENLPHPAEYEPVQCRNKQTPNCSAQETSEYDDIYVVPADNVTDLYAQLEGILSDAVCRNNISLGDMLGSGQFGEVYRGVWKRNHSNLEVAVKTLKAGSSENDRVKFLQEAAIMGQFKHPNVVTMHGVVTDEEPILLVLEMLKKGDLRGYLLSMRTGDEEINPEINEHKLLSYCRHVAAGMVYLSNKAFVHRDLAARNILVSADTICKIADFGMSRDLADENYYISHGGKIPVKWTAPEALLYKKYSTASDVWSFGVVMYEIWSVGHKPYERIDNVKLLRLLKSGYRLPPPPGCPRAIYNMMMSCWHPEPGGRPTFDDISTQLSASNSKLLHWSDEDKLKYPSSTKLGANLAHAMNAYQDIQQRFIKVQ